MESVRLSIRWREAKPSSADVEGPMSLITVSDHFSSWLSHTMWRSLTFPLTCLSLTASLSPVDSILKDAETVVLCFLLMPNARDWEVISSVFQICASRSSYFQEHHTGVC